MTGQIGEDIYNEAMLKGEEQGQLTMDEIYAIFDGFDETIIDKFIEESVQRGIALIDENDNVRKEIGEAESINEDTGINYLLRDLKKYPSLSPEENVELAKKIELGDEDAKEYMINCNMWIVITMAYRYLNKGVQLEDLVSAGTMGLVMACNKYDYRRNVKFSTYAFWWIRQYLRFAIAECGYAARLPIYMYNKLCTYKKMVYELTQQHGKAPTDEDVAECMGESLDVVAILSLYSQSVVELDAKINKEHSDRSGDIDILDLISSDDYDKDSVARRNAHKNIINSFDILTPREKMVIEHRYGIENYSKTLDDIAQNTKLTKERIRQIENNAMRKLRHPLNLKRMCGK